MRAAVTVTGDHVEVRFLAPEGTDEEPDEQAEEAVHAAEPESDLNPISPELKEIAWGFGSFVLLAVVLRYALYPRLRNSIDARYALIRGGHEQADQITAAAEGDAADYEAQLAAARAEAAQRIDAARATLEAERTAKLADVNARIAERRAAAAAELEQARAAVQGDVEAAVRDVAAAAGRLATGREPDAAVVSEAVQDVLGAGVAR